LKKLLLFIKALLERLWGDSGGRLYRLRPETAPRQYEMWGCSSSNQEAAFSSRFQEKILVIPHAQRLAGLCVLRHRLSERNVIVNLIPNALLALGTAMTLAGCVSAGMAEHHVQNSLADECAQQGKIFVQTAGVAASNGVVAQANAQGHCSGPGDPDYPGPPPPPPGQ
jgi:hypothetical protein